MRLVSIAMLTPDMKLAKSIYVRDCMMLKAGQENISKYANHLANIGIEYVYVEDKQSEGIEIPDVISEATRVQCKKVLRETIETFAERSTLEIQQISNVVDLILQDIMVNHDVQVSLNDIIATDDYTFAHSVSTTVYAVLIAKELRYSRAMLEKLAIGTILHDIGKTLLDKEILFKDQKLTEEEFEYIKQHTTLGYEALKKCGSLTELSRIVSLLHHERMDGTGYPQGIPAGDLHEFVRIVAIADVYDALVSDRCYRKKWTNEQAVNFLIQNSGTMFDAKLVALFIQQIAIYPNGSYVRLSTGEYGIIKEQNRSMPLRPIVRVVADQKGNAIPIYEMDLVKVLSVTIIQMNNDITSQKKSRNE